MTIWQKESKNYPLSDESIIELYWLRDEKAIEESDVKYGKYLPAFLRKLTRVNAPQLSLSKYALCRAQIGGISL